MRARLRPLALAGLVVAVIAAPSAAAADGLQRLWARTCEAPVTVHLDAVDDRFELDRAEVRAALRDAMAMWQDASEDTLFRKRDGEGVAVSLVYDERQAGAQARQRRRDDLVRVERQLREDRQQLEQRHEALTAESRDFESRQRRLNERVEAHEREVTAWNAGDMERTPEKRERLQDASQALSEAQDALNDERRELERRGEALNREQQVLVREMEAFNHQVDVHNREAHAATGFEMGQYERRGSQRWIRVFKADDQDELRLVLAHELGHALGIGHVPDADAVMAPYLGGDNTGRTAVSAADREALSQACRVTLTTDEQGLPPSHHGPIIHR
ncbi:matrixin family metalloprotease [Aquisalimonas asiatica]|uniref:Matrixin n=1 Tax=Aquisalimonas asiatica TaxID=406100 RepID=A0A1H8TII3_9GAMM|nr:matrixin family metalloprotease [Aquisalimonas asiatica]SEO90742.1 Matrixin [Aquisalimonas asiatica]